MSFNCNFCEGFTIHRCSSSIWCCCQKQDSDEGEEDREVVYVNGDGPDQFVLLNTPFSECKEWIILDDIPFSTTTVFFKDNEGSIRVLMHNEPHDMRYRTNSHGTRNDSSDHGLERKSSGLHECRGGIRVSEILAPHLRTPLIRFMEDTLEGTFYQMHALFNSSAKLIRTFPIFDYSNTVIGGMMIIGPISTFSDDEIQQFVLKRQEGPPAQDMVESPPHDFDIMPSTKHMGMQSLRKKPSTL